ncbi:MAG: DUF3800 domain-containing protein, partial [Candidatus Saccharibacteria bacterium]|nr:DUF3800 domain-containing protein [Candidatus Saccharibacteria bacterium]
NDISQIRLSAKFAKTAEFKFRKTRQEVKQLFFDRIQHSDFSATVIVVDKQQIQAPLLRQNPSQFYNSIILASCLALGNLQNAYLYIDGEGGSGYKKKVLAFLRQNLPMKSIKKLIYVDSKKNNLIQLADMIAGAVMETLERKLAIKQSFLKKIAKKVKIIRY